MVRGHVKEVFYGQAEGWVGGPYAPKILALAERGGGSGLCPTVHWIQDNFVFGQNSKSLLVFRNGPLRSFGIGIFYATFEKQNGY